jgi:hypothetical protein
MESDYLEAAQRIIQQRWQAAAGGSPQYWSSGPRPASRFVKSESLANLYSSSITARSTRAAI